MSEHEKSHKFRRDRFFKARGGTAQFLYLYCGKCQSFLALYQKDGPGNLFRLYLDRFFEPEELVLRVSSVDKASLKAFTCAYCGHVIGLPMVYKPENRLAFQIVRGALRKMRNRRKNE